MAIIRSIHNDTGLKDIDIAFIYTEYFNSNVSKYDIGDFLKLFKVNAINLPRLSDVTIEIDDDIGNTHLSPAFCVHPVNKHTIEIRPSEIVLSMFSGDLIEFFTAEQSKPNKG